MFDKDNSGTITKEEIINALKAEKSQEKEIEKYINAVDKNGDGKIDYKEFLELMGAEK
jgi:calmodulin